MVRDAERLPWRPVGDDAVPAGRPEVWVRLGGVWCRGLVVAWQRAPAGWWAAWTQHDIPDNAAGWSEHSWLRYDEESMRPRVDNQPPAE